jgi:hypothetical protein
MSNRLNLSASTLRISASLGVALATLTACSAGGSAKSPPASLATPLPAQISTVAGTGTVCTPALLPCGDGGPASRAPLGTPDAATALPDAGYLIAERDVEKIRRVSPEGIISTATETGFACPQPTSPVATAVPPARRRSTILTSSSPLLTAAT